MRTNQIGTFRGIPVQANWGAAAIAIFFGLAVATGVLPTLAPEATDAAYFLGGLLAGFGLLGSIFIHEAAHAVVAVRYGVPVKSITLWLLGGVAQLEKEAPTPAAEARIAGVGPLTSVIVGVVLLTVGFGMDVIGVAPALGATLLWLGGLNMLLAVFNVLPGAPLDGGRLLHAWLWNRSGSRARATAGASKAGRFLGIAVGIVGLAQLFSGNLGGLWTAAIGWFLYTAAGQEAIAGRLAAALDGKTMSDIMSPLPKTVTDWSLVSDLLSRPERPERLMAVDFGGSPTAVVTLPELARAAAGNRTNDAELRLRDLSLPQLVRISADSDAASMLRQQGTRFIVTIDDAPVGVVTSTEVDRTVFLHRLAASEATVDAHPPWAA
jgi:Zn-dependent protease